MAKNGDRSKDPTKALRTNERKWGKKLLEAGWTLVPSVILERQQALGLDALDVNILLQIIRHWWEPDRLPYPSKRTIAECMKVDPRTVQRRIANLEAGGLIRRVPRKSAIRGQQSNTYDLSGLIKEATPYAAEAVRLRAERRKEQDARRTRRRLIAGPAAPDDAE